MDMALIQGTISGLKTASDIARGFLELKSMVDVQGKVIDLQSAILNAQTSALAANAEQIALADEIRGLKEEINRFKAWEIEKSRYKLIAPWGSGVAYALKQSMNGSEPAHLLCTNCYQTRRKSILNPTSDKNNFTWYVCPVCKSELPTGYRGRVEPNYAEDD